jgi:hypothetical protein
MTDPLRPRPGRPIPGDPPDPLDPFDPLDPGRPPRPGRPPVGWTPFGPGDDHAPDPQGVVNDAERIREILGKARRELTFMRHGPGPDGTPPVVVETTRAEGLWPWLLIRQQTGDIGDRPLDQQTITAIGFGERRSPDILLTIAGPVTEPAVIGRADMPALAARAVSELHPGLDYDAWVHVWNLGRTRATGVRVRVFLGPTNRFLGGRQLDLGDRLAADSHRVVKAATFSAGGPSHSALVMMAAVAECLSDPAGSDRNPGMDRHCAHRLIYTSGL